MDFKSTPQNFLPALKDHLLGRMFETPEGGFTQDHRRLLQVYNNRLYQHKTLRINFTTYNCRRDQDIINLQTKSDAIVLADEDEVAGKMHPYWYARIIGIFHGMVCWAGAGGTNAFEQMDFLWVRWYGYDTHSRSGFKARRLHQIGFLDSHEDKEAFGFIDPSDVIRAVHLIPVFKLGTSSELLPPSIARHEDEGDEDYVRYYVAMCVLFPYYELVLNADIGLSIVTCLHDFVDLAQDTSRHET